jgi:hypothetical protein
MALPKQRPNLALTRRGRRRSFERPSSASNNVRASLEMREQLKGLPPASPTSGRGQRSSYAESEENQK